MAETGMEPELSSKETEPELESRKRPEFNGTGTVLQPWCGSITTLAEIKAVAEQ
uniref:Uncharacterized protein n=1 Tax=Acrobeloides nanus TaxID=290746 RepID=A0A914DMC7_9BILA